MSDELLGHRAWWCPSLDNEGNGTSTLNDRIFANDGTLTNMDAASDWVADTELGGIRALDFDGINDEVLFSSAISQMPFSVSLWAKCRQDTLLQSVFGMGNSGSTSQLFTIQFRGDIAGDPIYAQMRGSNPASNTFASFDGYSINTWHHIVAVFRSGSYRQIYVDGVAGTADTTTHTVETLNRMSIGSLPRTTSGLFFNGLVDDVRIFPDELSQATITELASRRAYQQVSAGFTGIRGTTRTLGT